MIRTRFLRFGMLSLLALGVLFSGALSPVKAQDLQEPDAFAYSNISGAIQSQWVKKITALPEWGDFVKKLTTKIDEEYVKNSSKPEFPKEPANMLLDKVRDYAGKQDIGSEDVFRAYFENVEAAQLNIWLDPAAEEPEGLLMVYTKFDPSELESLLKFAPPQIYSTLKKETNTTLYKFTIDNKEVFIGFTLVDQLSSRYVIVLSDKLPRVEAQLKNAKKGSQVVFENTAAFKKVLLQPSFFEKARERAVREIREKTNGQTQAETAINILENVESLVFAVGDQSDATRMSLSLTMKNEEEAKNIKELAEGGIALLKLLGTLNAELDDNAKKAIELAAKIQLSHESRTATASFNLTDPAVLDLFQFGLREILKKMDE